MQLNQSATHRTTSIRSASSHFTPRSADLPHYECLFAVFVKTRSGAALNGRLYIMARMQQRQARVASAQPEWVAIPLRKTDVPIEGCSPSFEDGLRWFFWHSMTEVSRLGPILHRLSWRPSDQPKPQSQSTQWKSQTGSNSRVAQVNLPNPPSAVRGMIITVKDEHRKKASRSKSSSVGDPKITFQHPDYGSVTAAVYKHATLISEGPAAPAPVASARSNSQIRPSRPRSAAIASRPNSWMGPDAQPPSSTASRSNSVIGPARQAISATTSRSNSWADPPSRPVSAPGSRSSSQRRLLPTSQISK